MSILDRYKKTAREKKRETHVRTNTDQYNK